MNLQRRLKHEWNDFLQSPPGRRFQDRYHRRRKQAPSGAGRVLSLSIGVGLLIAGLVMLFVPGPGILAMVVGIGVIAEQSHLLARVLDWLDLRLRQAARRIQRIWKYPT